jgi:D-lactate dehydrogenase
MRVAVFSTKPYDRRSLEAANAAHGHELAFIESRLGPDTATLAQGFPAVCVFVNDVVDAATLETLAAGGTRLVALRCAGFNNVDLAAAQRLGIAVARVPAYSPHAVSEFTIGLILTLNRQIHRAYNRVRENNFALDGLLGFDLHGKTVGIIGTGKIGGLVARTLKLGFGCEVLAHDVHPDPALAGIGVAYTEVADIAKRSDILTLHCPLTPQTRHIVDADSIARGKRGFMLVNTSRGALIDASAVIDGLKSGQIGYLAIDVYEQEADLFFEDLSSEIVQDDVFQRLLTFPNVLVTGHQAFFTREALGNIAETTLGNVAAFGRGEVLANRVEAASVAAGGG